MINFLSVPSNVELTYTGADHYLKHYRELRSRYADNPERMVDGMLAEPTTPNYWFMVPMRIEDRLFRVASIAHYKSHPIDALLALLERYKGYVLGPPWHYQDDEHLQDASHFESIQAAPQHRYPGRTWNGASLAKTCRPPVASRGQQCF